MKKHLIAFNILIILISAIQTACTLPSAVKLPSSQDLQNNSVTFEDLKNLPPPVYLISAGDVLRIVRESEEKFIEQSILFEVSPDGLISYPYVGSVKASGKTPLALQEELTNKLASIYKQPNVTINIQKTNSNKIFVGGAVKSPNAFDVPAVQTIEQAIISAGGLLNSADADHVALLRVNDNGEYQVYFSNFGKILDPSSKVRGIKLARGDVLFVPKSGIGNAVDGVDMYLNQLIPFTKSLGLGFTYVLHQPNFVTTTKTQ